MKLRATGLLLAALLLVGALLPAYAAAAADAEPVPEAEQAGLQTEESAAPFYLDGEPISTFVYDSYDGNYYVTVESFLAALCDESAVNEAGGVLTGEAVIRTETVEALDDETGTASVEVTESTLTVAATAGKQYVEANSRCLYVPKTVRLVEGRVALPIRTLAYLCNLKVAYTGSVQLAHVQGAPAFLYDGAWIYDSDSLYWLSHIINAESGNQPLEGKIAVGNVVMNRVRSAGFPNTIKAVIFQKNQFSPAKTGSIYRTPNAESVAAAKLILEGVEILPSALFFNAKGMNTYAARNRSYVTTIGGHAFYE